MYQLCNTTSDLNKTSVLLEAVLKSALESPRPNPNPLSSVSPSSLSVPLTSSLLSRGDINAAPVAALDASGISPFKESDVPSIVLPEASDTAPHPPCNFLSFLSLLFFF